MDNSTLANATTDLCVDSEQTPYPSVIWVALAVLMLATFFGNLLVIVSIAYFRQLHTPTNFLVLSLAVSDMLLGVSVLPFVTFLSMTPCSIHQKFLCRVKSLFDSLLCFASILNLYCICIDRYYAICRPLSYHSKINSRVIAGMISMTWSAAVVLALVVAFGGKKNKARCAITQNMRLSFLAALCAFYVPAVVMSTLYTKILLVVRRQVRSIQVANSSESVSKAERKATLTLAKVICAFLLLWAPFSICSTYPFSLPLPVFETFKFFGWFNSALNPFIYAYSHSWYRSAFRLFLTGKIFTETCANTRLN
ncbi:trace amine-associated receptor 9-like [Eucyclogobius newberryi]|uniref:trace amine-associated receptor 9-like n=1 Tax=Eucyclogobius newberryi TaxID=166745 RepID=UPI003B59FE5C